MKTKFIFMTLVCMGISMGCQVTSDIPPAMSLYGATSDLIFRGTVRVLHTSTIDSSDPESMGVVRVTDVIKNPDMVPGLTRKDITVTFRDIKSVQPEDDLIFFTRLDFLGDEIGVTELGHMQPDAGGSYSSEKLRAQASEVMKQAQDETLKTLVRQSDVIISGKINRTVLMKAATNKDTEHDPMWTEAFVQVSETLKGKSEATMSFFYAASTDIAWYQSPKLKEGDEGTFLLQLQDKTPALSGRLALLKQSEWQTDKANIDAIKKYVKQ